MKTYISVIMAMTMLTLFAQEKSNSSIEKWSSGRPDGHAPITLMGDHMHQKGEWMFSYRWMSMDMEDLKNISNDDAHDLGDMVTPNSMNMDMHMFGFMYAPSNKVTLMAMSNYSTKAMELQMRMTNDMGMNMYNRFTTSSSGFGDLKITALYKLFNKNRQTALAQLGFSIPSGSIVHKNVTPMFSPTNILLPYPMQTGSGTLGLNMALTYLGQSYNFSWGLQGRAMVPLGENKEEYALGNKFCTAGWIAVKASDSFSFSGKV